MRGLVLAAVFFVLWWAVPAATQAIVGTSLSIDSGVARLELRQGSNEITFAATHPNDAIKFRFATAAGDQACLSFNNLANLAFPFEQQEYALVCGATTEDDPGSLGGSLKIYARMKGAGSDGAMRLMAVISPAFTSDGLPVVLLYPNLGRFAQGASPPSLAGVVELVNLSGTPIGAWARVVSANLDTAATVDVPLSSSQSYVVLSVRRAGAGATAPYLYLTVDDVPRVWGYRVQGGAEQLLIPVVGGALHRLRVRGSSQDGAIEVGFVGGQ